MKLNIKVDVLQLNRDILFYAQIANPDYCSIEEYKKKIWNMLYERDRFNGLNRSAATDEVSEEYKIQYIKDIELVGVEEAFSDDIDYFNEDGWVESENSEPKIIDEEKEHRGFNEFIKDDSASTIEGRVSNERETVVAIEDIDWSMLEDSVDDEYVNEQESEYVEGKNNESEQVQESSIDDDFDDYGLDQYSEEIEDIKDYDEEIEYGKGEEEWVDEEENIDEWVEDDWVDVEDEWQEDEYNTSGDSIDVQEEISEDIDGENWSEQKSVENVTEEGERKNEGNIVVGSEQSGTKVIEVDHNIDREGYKVHPANSLREFIKLNPNCTIKLAAQYFSVKEVRRMIDMGTVYQKNGVLYI